MEYQVEIMSLIVDFHGDKAQCRTIAIAECWTHIQYQVNILVVGEVYSLNSGGWIVQIRKKTHVPWYTLRGLNNLLFTSCND